MKHKTKKHPNNKMWHVIWKAMPGKTKFMQMGNQKHRKRQVGYINLINKNLFKTMEPLNNLPA